MRRNALTTAMALIVMLVPGLAAAGNIDIAGANAETLFADDASGSSVAVDVTTTALVVLPARVATLAAPVDDVNAPTPQPFSFVSCDGFANEGSSEASLCSVADVLVYESTDAAVAASPDQTAVPEPLTLLLLAAGLIGGSIAVRRRRRDAE
jgi:PEP-CTERM motif